MKRKRILFVNGHMNYGGIERSLLDILRNIDLSKFEIDLLLIEGKGDYYKHLPTEINIIYKNLNNTYGSFFRSIWKSVKERDIISLAARVVFMGKGLIHPNFLQLLRIPLLGCRTYDFAIAFRPGICTDLVLYSVNAKKKATWWHNGELNLSDAQRKKFEKTCLMLKNIVVVSNPLAKIISDAMPALKNLITVIPNMIDTKNIHMMSDQFSAGFTKNKWNFVTASRIAPEKHIENIIYASEFLIHRGFVNFKWYLVGEGRDFEKIKLLAESRNTENYVMFLGKKENPYPYIKSADLYIHTSYVESQGLSILEAMALNISCIITDNDGVRDYATAVNSVIVPQGPEYLANAIFDLLDDQNRFDLLRQNTKCPEQFTVPIIMPKIEKFLS